MSGKHYVYAGAVALAVAGALSLSVSVTQATNSHDTPSFRASYPMGRGPRCRCRAQATLEPRS